ncbi:MAG: hypothetical protein AAGA61_02315 [Pseudomonadota bacterium]
MKKLLKLMHWAGAIAVLGGMVVMMLLVATAPDRMTDLAGYAAVRASLATLANWVIVPGLGIALFSGLMGMAIHPPFHSAGWALTKALSGLVLFESSLATIVAPADKAARITAEAVAGNIDLIAMDSGINDIWGAWWVLLGIAILNVVLGVWRPRIRRRAEAPA